MTTNQRLFALDIGTRKVAGIVLESTEQGLQVIAASRKEHPDRAMLDGQVHKVEAVAKVVKAIKADLEDQLGQPLVQASLAAAGRALLTESFEKTFRYPHPTEVTRARVRSLELLAAKAAQSSIQSREKNYQLHCVGYSTIHYLLDDQLIDELVGHQAKKIAVKVIATFLPRQVVDAMLTVMRQADLEAASLTLEPIAAIEATIPPDMRRMNLALVDIGAGTSDIALTREGSVFAYDMVTQAGDEITEFLCDHLLLEFNEAERVKRLIGSDGDEVISYQTLLGKYQEKSKEELIRCLEPVVSNLAQAIATTIIKLNEQPPRAIILVGGGSSTPGLDKQLAKTLSISEERIGVRGPETITAIKQPLNQLGGIEWVTPLGIALTASRQHGLSFKKVTVNQQIIQLLALNQHNSVFDALLTAGYEANQLLPTFGQALTYTLAGQLMTVPGQSGQPAKITVNDQVATLDTAIQDGDVITVTDGIPGQDARLPAQHVPQPAGPAYCTINDQRVELNLALFQRDQKVSQDSLIPDRAELEWMSEAELGELIPELKQIKKIEDQFMIKINGIEKKINGNNLSITLDGRAIDCCYHPRPGDRIVWHQPQEKKLYLHELVETLPEANTITVTVNGQLKTIDTGGSRVLVNGREAQTNAMVNSSDEIQIEDKQAAVPMLSHVLEGIHPPPQAGPIRIRVNGQEAGYATPLFDGANIEISFG